MRKILITLVLLSVLTACSKKGLLPQVDDLVKAKKYQTAYALLEQADPQNHDIDIVLTKISIALEDYATTNGLQSFTFQDLKADQDIEDVRGQNGGTLYTLDPEAVLLTMSLDHHGDWRLFQALGDYEHLHYLNYDRLAKNKGLETLGMAQNNYYQALTHHAGDGKLLYRMGRVLLDMGEFSEAAKDLKDSIAAGNDTGDSNYHCALAFWKTGKPSDCAAYAKKALELYRRAADKVRAAQLAGEACLAMGNEPEAMKYFEIVSELRPNNYNNRKSLLGLSLRHKEMDKAAATAKAMLGSGPKDREILEDVRAAYSGAKALREFRDFLEKMKGPYGKDNEVLGNLYLFQAKAEAEEQKKGDALESLKRAREYYSKVLKPNAKVFKTLEEEKKRVERSK
jgi:tetratricopeptide (TPR) repeat protein